jgi:uncharacterized protein YjaZ
LNAMQILALGLAGFISPMHGADGLGRWIRPMDQADLQARWTTVTLSRGHEKRTMCARIELSGWI